MTDAKNTGPTDADLVSGFHHIVIREGYLGGKAALKERRISISQILDALAGGMTISEMWETYRVPQESITEVLRYAAQITGSSKCC